MPRGVPGLIIGATSLHFTNKIIRRDFVVVVEIEDEYRRRARRCRAEEAARVPNWIGGIPPALP